MNEKKAREKFAAGSSGNFSVVAAAGSGKTTAVVRRIIRIALDLPPENAARLYERLVVVTYTNTAANEMRQRARVEISRAQAPYEVMRAFGKITFGTIHSFAVELIRQHGHRLGLPPQLELLTEDAEELLWSDFLTTLEEREGTAELWRHVKVEQVLDLALKLKRIDHEPGEAPFAEPDVAPLLDFPVGGVRRDSLPGIEDAQRKLERWLRQKGFRELPVYKNNQKNFRQLFDETFAPVRKWRAAAAFAAAAAVARAWEEFRFSRGQFTYDDQIELARRLTRHAGAIAAIRRREYHVLLDEAQDTDPAQFEFLIEIARSSPEQPPEPGRFSLVGDPQQSIYPEKSDLEVYAEARAAAGAELAFDTTFRCPRRVIEAVNKVFPDLLTGKEGQTPYSPLREHENSREGQALRLKIAPDDEAEELKTAEAAGIECRKLAEWIAAQGLENLRAENWSEVAILSPRKLLLPQLHAALEAAGVPAQLLSTPERYAQQPVHAWFSALLVALAEPRNAFEIFGVLREIFGVEDAALAQWLEGYPDRLYLSRSGKGERIDALELLRDVWRETRELPLYSAVRTAVERVELRERLLSLPLDENEALAQLDELLLQAAAAEADGRTLFQFAEELKQQRLMGVTPRERPRDAVQLISAHSAKGLGWDCVILPFLWYPSREFGPKYPLVLRERGSGNVRVALESADLEHSEREELKRKNAQALDRLLYVMMTRAKQTLVLVDDRELFEREKPVRAGRALAVRLRQSKNFQRLLDELHGEPAAELRLEGGVSEIADEILPAVNVEAAAEASRVHLRQTLPHTLAGKWQPEEPEARDEFRPELAAVFPGVEYGTWWHAALQELRWQGSEAEEKAWLREQLDLCPDRERGENELRNLLEHELRARLSNPEGVIHKEAPVLQRCGDEAFEGFVDLAAFDPQRNEWLVIDWKTDRVEKAADLRTRYGPQIRTYCRMARELTERAVRGAIYSTALGVLVEIDADE